MDFLKQVSIEIYPEGASDEERKSYSDVAEAIKPNVDENSQKVFDYIAEVSKIATPIDDPDPSGKGEVEAQAKTIVENLRYGDTDAAGAAEEFVTTSQKILSEAAK